MQQLRTRSTVDVRKSIGFRSLFLSILLWLIACPVFLHAQIMSRDSAKGQQVDILNAGVLEQLQQGEVLLQYLQQAVILKHDSMLMRCDTGTIRNKTRVKAWGNVTIQQGDSLAVFADSLLYDADTMLAILRGREVILVNHDERLFTRVLSYHTGTSVATFSTRGLLDNGQTQLSADKGTYFLKDSLAMFRDSVVVVDSLFTLRTDSLRFHTGRRLAQYEGPTRIDQGETDLYCESGYYDIPQQKALFAVNAQYRNGDRQAAADSMFYDGAGNEILLVGHVVVKEPNREASADRILFLEDTEEYFLYGNATLVNDGQEVSGDSLYFDARTEVYMSIGRSVLSDSVQILEALSLDYNAATGLGSAIGDVYWRDTSAGISIVCEEARYNRACDYMVASGSRRPLFISETNDDSLFMTADTLLAPGRCDSQVVNGRLILAYRDVRLFSRDLQAVCDSLAYREVDSLFTLYPLQNTPLIWSDTSLQRGDTIHIQMAGGSISRIYLRQNAWLVNSPDMRYFNQIKGRDITAQFRNEVLHEVLVNGNAEAVYYVQDETGAYVGPNQVSASSMRISFTDGQVSDIRLFNAPSGELKALPRQGIQLPGFPWTETCRPRSVSDLFAPGFCRPSESGDLKQ